MASVLACNCTNRKKLSRRARPRFFTTATRCWAVAGFAGRRRSRRRKKILDGRRTPACLEHVSRCGNCPTDRSSTGGRTFRGVHEHHSANPIDLLVGRQNRRRRGNARVFENNDWLLQIARAKASLLAPLQASRNYCVPSKRRFAGIFAVGDGAVFRLTFPGVRGHRGRRLVSKFAVPDPAASVGNISACSNRSEGE